MTSRFWRGRRLAPEPPVFPHLGPRTPGWGRCKRRGRRQHEALCARDIGRLRIFPRRDHQRSSETAAPLFYRGEKFDGRRRSLVSTQTASACRKYWCAGIPMPRCAAPAIPGIELSGRLPIGAEMLPNRPARRCSSAPVADHALHLRRAGSPQSASSSTPGQAGSAVLDRNCGNR